MVKLIRVQLFNQDSGGVSFSSTATSDNELFSWKHLNLGLLDKINNNNTLGKWEVTRVTAKYLMTE